MPKLEENEISVEDALTIGEDEDVTDAMPDPDADPLGFELYADPLEWLSAPREVVGHVLIGNKGVKITSVTDAELEAIQKSARRPHNGNARDMRLNQMVFRRSLIATSINKAYGYSNPALPGYVTQDKLRALPAGELGKISEEIMKVSGFNTGAEKPEDFFD